MILILGFVIQLSAIGWAIGLEYVNLRLFTDLESRRNCRAQPDR